MIAQYLHAACHICDIAIRVFNLFYHQCVFCHPDYFFLIIIIVHGAAPDLAWSWYVLCKFVGRIIKPGSQNLVQVLEYLGCNIGVTSAKSIQIVLGQA